jgi:hypothetical protein
MGEPVRTLTITIYDHDEEPDIIENKTAGLVYQQDPDGRLTCLKSRHISKDDAQALALPVSVLAGVSPLETKGRNRELLELLDHAAIQKEGAVSEQDFERAARWRDYADAVSQLLLIQSVHSDLPTLRPYSGEDPTFHVEHHDIKNVGPRWSILGPGGPLATSRTYHQARYLLDLLTGNQDAVATVYGRQWLAFLTLVQEIVQEEMKHKSLSDLTLSAAAELGEFCEEALIAQRVFGQGHRKAGRDGPQGEAVDVLICALALFFATKGTSDILLSKATTKLDKWQGQQRLALAQPLDPSSQQPASKSENKGKPAI